MVTSWPAWVSSYPETSPARPAPTTRTFFGDAACCNACGVKLQVSSGVKFAEAAASKPSLRNSLRSIGMDSRPPETRCSVISQNCTQADEECVVGKPEAGEYA